MLLLEVIPLIILLPEIILYMALAVDVTNIVKQNSITINDYMQTQEFTAKFTICHSAASLIQQAWFIFLLVLIIQRFKLWERLKIEEKTGLNF